MCLPFYLQECNRSTNTEFESSMYRTALKSISIFFRVRGFFYSPRETEWIKEFICRHARQDEDVPMQKLLQWKIVSILRKSKHLPSKGLFQYIYIFQPLIEFLIEISWECKRKSFYSSNMEVKLEKRKYTHFPFMGQQCTAFFIKYLFLAILFPLPFLNAFTRELKIRKIYFR